MIFQQIIFCTSEPDRLIRIRETLFYDLVETHIVNRVEEKM